jgi:hypothetical protein
MEPIPQPLNPNESGRQSKDPSVKLMTYIGRLQRTPVKDEIIVLPEDVAAEALQVVKDQGWARVVHPEDPNAFMFCRHWVCPPPVANESNPPPKAA